MQLVGGSLGYALVRLLYPQSRELAAELAERGPGTPRPPDDGDSDGDSDDTSSKEFST
jgi:hypothetical protein